MSSSLKRKTATSLSSHLSNKKPRATLDTFFSPQVPLAKKSTDDPAGPSHVALNPEQTRVLRMVIDEGKSVFFTGAAGACSAVLFFSSMTKTSDNRHRKVSTTSCYHQSSSTEIFEIEGCDIYHSEYRNGRFKYWRSVLSLSKLQYHNVNPVSIGMTIHSWGAVTPNCTDMNLMIKCIKTCRPALQRWKKTQVLIVDEGRSQSITTQVIFPQPSY